MKYKKFVRDRDEALLSLDKDKIVAYCNKYGVPVPDNEIVFWAGVHKSIIALNSAPVDRKIDSHMWLVAHGFKGGIGND